MDRITDQKNLVYRTDSLSLAATTTDTVFGVILYDSRVPPDRPNVLLVCTDQQRPDWFGWNDDVPVETPHVDRLAARGVRFENAVCPTPVCNPCRSCLASGMAYDRTGVPNNEVDYDVDRGTLYRRLRDEGDYFVAGTGKFDLTAEYRLGMDGKTGIAEWGFSDAVFTPAKNETVSRVEDADGDPQGPYTNYLATEGLLDVHVEDYRRRRGDALTDGKLVSTFQTPLPEEAYYDEWITRQGIELMDQAPRDRPWFLQVNLQNPHDPWDVTETMHDRFRNPAVDFPEPAGVPDSVEPSVHQEVRRNYGAMVEHLDDCLGALLEALDARNELEDTIVLFTSDHGEMLGDYGQWQKDSPLAPSVNVPLVVAGPGVGARPPVDDPVTILDVYSTVLDYAGIERGSVDSRSMRPFLAGDSDSHRAVVYAGLSTWRMVFDGRFKLLRGYDPELRQGTRYEPRGIEPAEVTRLLYQRDPVLYDMEKEGEPVDVADSHPDVVERLTEELERIRGRPRTFG
jgi:choline-sulfatase